MPDAPAEVFDLVVLRREFVTPGMVRVVAGGPGLSGLTSVAPDDHVKIVFPDDDGQWRLPTRAAGDVALEWPRPFPATREYTIRRLSLDECWIDFVVHAGGLASDWAVACEPGDRMVITGPRTGYVVPPEFTHHLLLADHTALPAVARWLEDLAPGISADVAVRIPDSGEQQNLVVDERRRVTWLPDDGPVDSLAMFADAVPRDSARPTYLWAAGEASVLKPVRVWARTHGFARGTCDIAGYWRRPRTRTLPRPAGR